MLQVRNHFQQTKTRISHMNRLNQKHRDTEKKKVINTGPSTDLIISLSFAA